MKGLEKKSEKQGGFNFRESLYMAEKHSYTDYGPEEVARLELGISEAHMAHQRLTDEQQHYLILKTQAGK